MHESKSLSKSLANTRYGRKSLQLSTYTPEIDGISHLREISYLYANAKGISHNHAYIEQNQLSSTSNGKDALDEEAMEANLELKFLTTGKL